jgi:hypothetical protein
MTGRQGEFYLDIYALFNGGGGGGGASGSVVLRHCAKAGRLPARNPMG